MVYLKYGVHCHLYLFLSNKGYKVLYKPSTTNLPAKNSDFEEKLTSISSLVHNKPFSVLDKIKVIWHFLNQRIKRRNCIVIFLNNFNYLFNLHLSNYYANIHLF